jgi:phosphoserine phosphatase RsbU/P
MRRALVFCVLLTAYSIQWIYLVRHPLPALLGFDGLYRPISGGVEVMMTVHEHAAERAGLRVHDRIVAADGVPFTSYEQGLDLRRRAQPDRPIALRVLRGAQPLDLTLVSERRQGLSGMTGAWTSLALTEAFLQILAFYPVPFLVVAVVVLLQRPHDPHAWLLALMLGGFIASAPMAEFESRMPPWLRGPTFAMWVVLAEALPGICYAFFSVFPAHSTLDRRVPWLKYLAVGVPVLFAAPLALAFLVFGSLYPGVWAAERLGSWTRGASFAIGAYAIGCFLLAMISLAFNAFGRSDVRRKTQVILFGMVVGTVPIMLLRLVPAILGLPPERVPFWLLALSSMALFAVPASLGYAVVKHRAMEIPVLLRRSARYVLVRRGLVTTAVLVGMGVTIGFARIVGSVSEVPQNQLSVGLLAGSVFGGLLALLGQRAWQPAAERLDRAFFRGSYDARQLLQMLASQTRTATDRASLAELIDRVVLQALHPQMLLVFLRGDLDGQFTAAAHEGLTGAAATLPRLPVAGEELAGRGKPFLIDPAWLLPGESWASFEALAPEALVPLVGRSGQLEGLLVLGPRLSEEPYSGEDVELLASVGTQAGLALENIRLAETMAMRLEAERRVARELEIARDVQAKLLPQKRPPLRTLDYAGECLQARVVGGDFFDFVSVAPGRVGLVLADISGKGISAALLMASLQANLRAVYSQTTNDLSSVLAGVNQSFFDSTAANRYATLFFSLYDESTRELQYANCGHLPPILLRANGRLERLGVTGPVIGLFEDWRAETMAVTLEPGDLLVVFTDGVTEATAADGGEFGEDRLIAAVRRYRSESAAGLLQRVIAEVRQHGGPEQFDDLTLIVGKAV